MFPRVPKSVIFAKKFRRTIEWHMIARCLVLLSIGVFSSGVLAWNAAGHAAVAAIADSQLTPAARAQVSGLLLGDLDRQERPSGRKTLMEVASWADEIRDEAVKTEPLAYKGWHVRGNQVCSQKLGACREGHCVDELIIRFTAVLADRQQSSRARNEALKWVVHLVGDLHMPLHSGVNRNGGSARVQMEGVRLKADASFHSVWDSELLDAALRGWVRESVTISKADLPRDAASRWMIETRDLALREVYEPLPGFSCQASLPEPIVLDAAYQQASIAIVRRQIERAGLRLAQLLNASLH